MIIHKPPTPEEIQQQFHIPRTYIEHMATWMNLSSSMLFQMVRQGRKPSAATARKLSQDLGIPHELWENRVDIVAQKLYSMWYEQLTPYQADPHNLEDIF